MSKLREYIEKHPWESQRLVGLDYKQLIELMNQAQRLQNQRKQEAEQKKRRIIKGGGGRKTKLSEAEQVLLTLTYLHHLPTFQMLGIQFGVSESTANYIFHKWLEVLRDLLPASLLEQVKKKESEREWVKEILTILRTVFKPPEYHKTRLKED